MDENKIALKGGGRTFGKTITLIENINAPPRPDKIDIRYNRSTKLCLDDVIDDKIEKYIDDTNMLLKDMSLVNSLYDMFGTCWLARNKDGTISVYTHKPVKHNDKWLVSGEHIEIEVTNQLLFKNILWTNDEPFEVKGGIGWIGM